MQEVTGQAHLRPPPDGMYTGRLLAEEVKGEFRRAALAGPAEQDKLVDTAFVVLRAVSEQLNMECCSSLAKTRGVQVDATSACVVPGDGPGQFPYAFTYRISVTNSGDRAVQLKGRHWIITNERGEIVHSVPAGSPGVVGFQPIIRPGEAFEYYSGTDLCTPRGRMVGGFNMAEVAQGRGEPIEFYATVAPFLLDCPQPVASSTGSGAEEEET